MSDSAPLLLNLGAAIDPAAGVKSPGAGAGPAAADGNGFADILQSVLSPTMQPAGTDALLDKQIDINPLLFSQLDGSGDQLLNQDGMPLEVLPDGKGLPSDGQGLAWQTLLAKYDSQDPDTPQVVVAKGDDQGYALQELGPAELLALKQAGEAAKPDPATLNQPSSAAPDKKSDETDERPADLSAIMALMPGQDNSAQPATASPDNGTATDIAKLQAVSQARGAHPDHTAAVTSLSEKQTDNSVFAADDSAQLAKQPPIDALAQHFKSELSSAADNTVGKNTAPLSANSPNALLGTSAYATVSGLGTPASTPHNPTPPVIAHLTVPPQNPAWGDIIGDRVQWMANQHIQEAKIRLNPPELGLLEVSVHMGHDHQTHISFASPHSQVRDALETAVPRLREMFVDSGLSLGDVNVSQQSMSGQGHTGQDDNKGTPAGKSRMTSTNETAELAAVQPVTAHGSGMLDLYA